MGVGLIQCIYEIGMYQLSKSTMKGGEQTMLCEYQCQLGHAKLFVNKLLDKGLNFTVTHRDGYAIVGASIDDENLGLDLETYYEWKEQAND